MPQVKGKANWLTNTRRQSQLPRSIGIDNSNAHIENELVEFGMQRELDQLHLQAHRAMADRLHELNETKKDVSNYQRIKELATENRVDSLMDKRREQMQNWLFTNGHGPGDNPGLKGAKGTTSASSVKTRPTTGNIRPKSSKGFSQIHIDDDSDDDDYYFRFRNSGATPSATALKPTTPGHPSRSRRRPKTSQPARSIRQIRQALQDEFTKPKAKARPRTAIGFKGEDHINDDGKLGPERSFLELKDLVHIDSLSKSDTKRKEDAVRKIRDARIKGDQIQLQEKLKRFYDRIDRFKRESQTSVVKTTYSVIHV